MMGITPGCLRWWAAKLKISLKVEGYRAEAMRESHENRRAAGLVYKRKPVRSLPPTPLWRVTREND